MRDPTPLLLLLFIGALTTAAPVSKDDKGGQNTGTVEVKQPDDEVQELKQLLSKAPQARVQSPVVPAVPAQPQAVPQVAVTPAPQPAAKQTKIDNLDDLGNLDLTPHAVAEYLLITGDFAGFDQAVNDLVNSQVISLSDARQYKDAVGWEYEALLKRLVDAKEAYLNEMMDLAAAADPVLGMARERRVPAAASPVAADLDLALKKMELVRLLEKEATLDDLISALVDDYMVRGMSDFKTTPEDEQLAQLIEMMAKAEDDAAAAQQQAQIAPVAPQLPALPAQQAQPAQPQPQQLASAPARQEAAAQQAEVQHLAEEAHEVEAAEHLAAQMAAQKPQQQPQQMIGNQLPVAPQRPVEVAA